MRPRHATLLCIAILSVTACSQRDKKARVQDSAVVGRWESDSVSGAGGSARLARLLIREDGMAELVRVTPGRDSLVERGTWDGADSLLRVVVRTEGTAARATSILLAVRGGTLGLVQFDSTTWDAGQHFRRR
ncbi:MAG: hypothetical protein IT355_17145 [Gemmatimonadaceae bacterium]|nr:hypothetical protein [Gemmatimonadaceae bacterium]